MKGFTIATVKHNVAGHGDNYSSLVIQRDGSYESGEFPPIFPDRAEAEEYLNTMRYSGSERAVVEVNVLPPISIREWLT